MVKILKRLISTLKRYMSLRWQLALETLNNFILIGRSTLNIILMTRLIRLREIQYQSHIILFSLCKGALRMVSGQ